MEIKTAIIDDSQADLKLIKETLIAATEKTGHRFTIHSYTSFQNTEDLQNHDLFIFDIDMPDQSGFSAAREIQKVRPDAAILFCSWHEELVFESFRLHTFFFIRKSRLYDDMKTAVLKYLQDVRQSEYLFSHKKETILIPVRRIVYAESLKNELCIVTSDGKEYLERKTMQQFLEEIPQSLFLSVSAGCIVNLMYVSGITDSTVRLLNGSSFTIPAYRISKVINEYLIKKGRYDSI